MKHSIGFPFPPPSGYIQPPIVYEEQTITWEYRQLVRNLAKESAPTPDELNAWGADGWELAGLFADSPFVYFYFKRLVRV